MGYLLKNSQKWLNVYILLMQNIDVKILNIFIVCIVLYKWKSYNKIEIKHLCVLFNYDTDSLRHRAYMHYLSRQELSFVPKCNLFLDFISYFILFNPFSVFRNSKEHRSKSTYVSYHGKNQSNIVLLIVPTITPRMQ